MNKVMENLLGFVFIGVWVIVMLLLFVVWELDSIRDLLKAL